MLDRLRRRSAPEDSAVVQLQQLESPRPTAMTFAETAMVFSAW